MTQNEPEPRDELKAIDRARFWIALTSTLALVVLATALFQAPPSAVVIVTLLILVALKKAWVRYRELGKKRAELLNAAAP